MEPIYKASMKDEKFKYLEITKAFPNRAGRLAQTLTTLKRLIAIEARKSQTNEVKALLIAASEAVDVGFEYNDWTLKMWQGVLDDYEVLGKIAEMKGIIEDQKETIKFYMENDISGRDKTTA